MLKLAGLWRVVGRPQEGVELLAKMREQKEFAELVSDFEDYDVEAAG